MLTRHIIICTMGNAAQLKQVHEIGCVSLQEDLLDVLYWLRQLIAVLAGVAWGFVPLTGLYAFVGYAR
jgi:hypothetical protein